MLVTRVLIAVMMPGLGLLLAGCGGVTIVEGGAKSVVEERSLTASHVPGSGIDVHTDVGSVEVVADPSSNEVKVIANVTAFGDTEEEAQSGLLEIKVKVGRREDQVLEIGAEFPKQGLGARGACSFVIRVPEANDSKVRTGNGSVTLTGLVGPADVHTGVGAVTVSDQGGNVTAQTGNGAVRLTKVAGDVHVTTSVGKVTVQGVAGAVRAKSGNGLVEITGAGETVEASTSVGAVTIRETVGAVRASTGNGAVAVARVKGSVKATTSVGRVTLEQVAGEVEAKTGNGSMTYAPAAGSDSPFHLQTSVGSVTLRLPASASGSIQASTSVGTVTVSGARQPRSVTGERRSKQIVLTEKGPASSVRTGNGGITIMLE
jgi:DUF4097 and DUF4098 domain-containing protein YvlB